MPQDPADRNRIIVEDEGQVVGHADLRSGQADTSVHVDLHAEPGHFRPGSHADVVDAAFDAAIDASDAEAGSSVSASLPAGDAEMLHRVRDRIEDAEARSAGSTVLVDGTVPDQTVSTGPKPDADVIGS